VEFREIIAKGRQITVKLNGHTIVDANLDSVTDPAVLHKHARPRAPPPDILAFWDTVPPRLVPERPGKGIALSRRRELP